MLPINDDLQGIFDDELPAELPDLDDISDDISDDTMDDSADADNDDGIKVIYNGREQTVKMVDAPTLIQKGMNYDHILSELEELRQETSIKTIKEHAAKNGVDYKDYVAMLEKLSYAGELDALKQKGILDRTQELFDQANALETDAKTRQRVKEQYENFVRDNPDVDTSLLPEEVLSAPINGGDIALAYLKHQNAMLSAKLSALQNQGAARDNAIGSASGVGNSEEGDALWKAFMGGR